MYCFCKTLELLVFIYVKMAINGEIKIMLFWKDTSTAFHTFTIVVTYVNSALHVLTSCWINVCLKKNHVCIIVIIYVVKTSLLNFKINQSYLAIENREHRRQECKIMNDIFVNKMKINSVLVFLYLNKTFCSE